MNSETIDLLREWAETYNDRRYFSEDPIIFPRHFVEHGGSLRDIEIAAVFAAHFAWGRRSMIVRDCERLFEHMEWRPMDYVQAGAYRDDSASIHRTIKWSEVALICARLKAYYAENESIETLDAAQLRTLIYGRKPDLSAPNKKIHMMRRWMVRDDGKVDLGVWKHSDKSQLLIPLDVHVHATATALGLTSRKAKDIATVREISAALGEVFPSDPCKGDFALFGYGVTHQN